MLVKYYEARCDYCGRTLDYFERLHPTADDIKRIGNVMERGRIFCNDECKQNFYHDMNLRKRQNLKQYR